MRTRPALVLLVALLAILALAPSPITLAQGDGPIEPVESPPPGEIDITPPPNDGDGTIEPEELPVSDQSPPPVEPTEPFGVTVECAFAPEAGVTDCVFTGVPPTGQATAVVFLVPAELVCAEVTGGEYAYVAPDPVTGLNGYRPIGNAGWLTLSLAGIVTPAGAATYWFESPGGIVPGTGPALACSPASSSQEPAPSPTPTPLPATGTLLVRSLLCTDIPADRAGYDWFGACEPVAYRLALAGAQGTSTPERTAQAETVFAELPPGRYDLAAMGFTWCHAVSDNVNPQSEVVIEPGARTTVWVFLCRGA